MEMSEFITVLPKTHKKQKVVKYFCTLCKCVIGDVIEHEDGEKHTRLLEIMEILPMLQQCGIGMLLFSCLLIILSFASYCCSIFLLINGRLVG